MRRGGVTQKVAIVLGLLFGFLAIEHRKPTPQRKARETHRLTTERPHTHHRR